MLMLPTTTSLLSWGLQTTLLLGAGWLLYRYALRQERFFDFNRRFLLGLPWVALLVPPLLAATEPGQWLSAWLPTPAPGSAGLLSGGVLPAITVRELSAGPLAGPLPWLLGLYGAGVVLLLVRLAAQLLHLHFSTRHFPREIHPDYVLVHTGGQQPISSFGRRVFWDETAPLTPAEARAVLAHELAHVRGHHTRERLLLEVARALLWPVPFVHLLPPALAQLHEFLADAAAVQATVEAPAPGRATAAPATYPALLARLALAQFRPDLPLTHSFTQSFTLTRIRMLTTAAPLRRWKRWLPLPVAALTLALVTSFNALAQSTTKPMPPPPPAVYKLVDQMPQYEGGQVQLLTDIGQLVIYPAEAKDAKLEGQVMIKFIITPAGKIEAAEVVKGIASGPAQAQAAQLLNDVALNAVRSLPGKWTPGRQNGEPVAVQYAIPISFALN